ncbi:MAG: hypothetical protein KAS32_00340 [Candidatus Peribacteraceae bacterium]|nr:hypothetical protein [Candidatus Peribacteraceae bacterium]
MKPFKNMTDLEFEKARQRNRFRRLGTFPRFCQLVGGYEFYYHGRQVFRWELFDWGYRDVERLLNNETDIKARVITEYLEL